MELGIRLIQIRIGKLNMSKIDTSERGIKC